MEQVKQVLLVFIENSTPYSALLDRTFIIVIAQLRTSRYNDYNELQSAGCRKKVQTQTT